jgi:FAD/FMN-containing dehydrogenase
MTISPSTETAQTTQAAPQPPSTPSTPTTPSTPSTPDAVADRLDPLRAWLAGALITPDSAEYDTYRQVRDITLERHPLAIVRAADADDVAAAVRCARDRSLPLAVRSGGHSLARQSTVDGALVIDLGAMNRIEIDPDTGIARVGSGATSADLSEPAHAHGLALSTGDTSSVGLGGLVTGGGIGFMARKYGLTIDNLRSAQVVTADGRVVTASADEHPDLFWAIRGGGGNAGIVTELELQLAPVSEIVGGEIVLPASRVVLRGFLEFAAAAPDDLTSIANLIQAPPFPHIPAACIGQTVLSILVCWTGAPDAMNAADTALAPLRALGQPIADTVRTMPYPALYDLTAHQVPPHGWALRSMFADALSDATLDASLRAVTQATSPMSMIQLRGMGGAVARVGRDETAFAHRDQRYLLAIIGIWLDPAQDAALHQHWTESLWREVRHEGDGVYVNFLEEEGEARVRDAYPSATLARLAAVKRAYDPTNLFRLNQNVQPTS